MNIGVWMSPAVLAHKLQARHDRNPEQAWNLARWPKALSNPGPHWLFVASARLWRGYFLLASDVLFNPRDASAPYALLFDTRTWTAIPPLPAKFFRGFTYAVPDLSPAPPTVP